MGGHCNPHDCCIGFTNKGLPIPTVKGMTFVDPKLLLGEVGYMEIYSLLSLYPM